MQPSSSSAILNRVTGSATSTIAGSLNANGQVYLVNPNGIAITKTGTVNTGAFVASTLGIADSDFMAGKRGFAGNGASAGVSNDGAITIARGGYMALIGGTVDNEGTITVPMGKAALGSGEQATLDLAGDGFLQVAVPTKASGNGALVKNGGKISANGGAVQLSAAAARDMARHAINMSGTIEARGVSGRNGAILLSGSDGEVAVSGKLSASNRTGKGGAITVTGRRIALAAAKLDASGKTGGGTIRIGGGRQGSGTLQHADSVSIDAATTIQADATETGNGGNVVVWSDLLTTFAGTISARGGAIFGDGGQAEVSGKAVLDYTGFTNLTAANGAFGDLLLDPYNVTISTGTNTSGFTASGNDSVINVTTLQNALAGANVTISTGSGGSQAGDITVAAPLTWSSGSTLTLDAYHSIAINAAMTITGAGKLNLTTNDGGSGGTLTFAGGVQYTGTPNTGQALTINGTAYTLLYSMSNLQGMSASGNFALARSLDASGVTNWSPLTFNGNLTGLGNIISNLTVTAPQTTNIDSLGLFAFLTGNISDIGLINGSVNGNSDIGTAKFVGGLVGQMRGGSIRNSFYSGTVVGGNMSTGGLVGFIDGGLPGTPVSIVNSYVTGSVSGLYDAGGLIGVMQQIVQTNNLFILDGCFSTAQVYGQDYVGGLVGFMANTRASNNYATGAVRGGRYDGALVAYSSGAPSAQATLREWSPLAKLPSASWLFMLTPISPLTASTTTTMTLGLPGVPTAAPA